MDASPLATPKTCSCCSASLANASLILVCPHDVCLACAARSLQSCVDGASSVCCNVCGSLTDLDEEAATYLRMMHENIPASDGAPSPADGSADKTHENIDQILSAGLGCQGLAGAAVCNEALSRDHSQIPNIFPHVEASLEDAVPPVIEQSDRASYSNTMHLPSTPDIGGRSARAGGMALTKATVHQEEPSDSITPSMFLRRAQLGNGFGQRGGLSEDIINGQSDELFGTVGGDSLRRRDNMPSHRPSSHRSKGGGPAVSSSSIGDPQPLDRRFLCCPYHPEEPLQYFCMTCQSECVCAECVLRGDLHRGHELLTVREAIKHLPRGVSGLTASVRQRSEQLTHVVGRAREGQRRAADLASEGRVTIRRAMEKVGSALRDEEAALFAEADRHHHDVVEILAPPAPSSSPSHTIEGVQNEPAKQLLDACSKLRQFHLQGDTAQALNWYSRLRKALSAPEPSSVHSEDAALVQLKVQLQQGFESKLAGVAAVDGCLGAITPYSHREFVS